MTMIAPTFPSGFPNGITVRGLPLQQVHSGEVFWVSNSTALPPGGIGGSDSNQGTFLKPFATIDYAIGRCTAGRGDIIFIKPGHAESLTTSGFIAADIAGVAFVGLGSGASQPTLSFTVATATLAITGANTSWNNIKFVSAAADGAWITLGAAADGASFDGCVFTDTSTTLNFLNFITLTSACDNVSFKDCFFCGKSASNDSFILMSTAHDRFYFSNCHMQSDIAQTSVVGLIKTTGAVTNCWIKDSLFRSNIDGAIFIDFDSASCSGAISNCYFSSINTAGATSEGIDFSGGHCFECYVAGEPNTFGLVGGGGVVYNDA